MLYYLLLLHFSILLLFFISSSMANVDNSASGEVGGIPGGRVNQNVNDEYIKNLVNKGLFKINKESNSAHYLALYKIEKAQSQVVSGSLYIITISVGKSECLKNQITSENMFECKYNGDPNDTKKYTIKIWSQPWKNFEQITYTEGDEEDEDE
ncbi:Cystatin domain-containing protein [Meloidogyne graminicola]|uniref:Cystatin domain-containing protein n=1 Tax=Meloidogyne graminicola TaxID=189291 RepID=A0A8S9ZII2_9BILA|nr:Cystatin domain-containing protein [Meloidogyne graminicola]